MYYMLFLLYIYRYGLINTRDSCVYISKERKYNRRCVCVYISKPRSENISRNLNIYIYPRRKNIDISTHFEWKCSIIHRRFVFQRLKI